MRRRLILKGGDSNIQKEIHRLAYTDYLTGLANRRGLYNYFSDLPDNSSMHFMFIDIDNFKRVNDVYGHSMGDVLLVQVSQLIRSKLSTGFISRVGGDEFVVIIDGSFKAEEVTAIAQSVIDGLNSIDFRKDILSLISLSVGIILEQNAGTDLDEILYKCDSAMYRAKSDGKNRYVVYRKIEKSIELAKRIESEMENALNNGEFHVYLQPKMNMITSKLVGAEALSRWLHPSEGIMKPSEYIPLFEKNGFIVRLDMFVYEKVCRIKSSWKGLPFEHINVSVNLSRLHFYHHDLPERLKAIADRYNVPVSELELEITESGFIKDSKEIITMVGRLRDIGFHVSIDDFGSGYSALNMIKDLPVDNIKIDKDFLKFSSANTRGQKVLKNIISMCKDLKLNIVSEGIETQQQIDFVTSCGCDICQGFFFSEPLTISEFNAYADKHYSPDADCIVFSFNGSLNSECGNYKGIFSGHGYTFDKGPTESLNSLYLPGGNINHNCLRLPNEVLINGSYTVAMWVKPMESRPWTSLFFAEFENGFLSFIPTAWDGNCSYRIRDTRISDGWFDTPACHLQENIWTHVAFSYNYITEKTYLYINGILSGHLDNIPSLFSTKNVVLGGDIYQESFQGFVSDLRIFNDMKTPTEINDLFLSVHSDSTFKI